MKFDFAHRSNQLRRALRAAERVLDAEGRLVVLDLETAAGLGRLAVRESTRSFRLRAPLHHLHSGPRGHYLVFGLERYRIELPGQTVFAVKIVEPFEAIYPIGCEELWVFPAEHYVRLYRHLRRKVRSSVRRRDEAPIMEPADRSRLYDNTIGFLLGDASLYQRYAVPRKRGVLLLGEPGNGKTMACRWLLKLSQDNGLQWRGITCETFDAAVREGHSEHLFRMSEPGLVLFDDFDLGMRNREKFGDSREHNAMLSGLDGVSQHDNVVYLFSTNVALADLDPAFLRRGRIDQIITFRRPTETLRREYLQRFWHADLLAAIDVEHVVAQTDGFSFAELAELKKLLVLRFLEGKGWDFSHAFAVFQTDRIAADRKPIGFSTALALRRESQPAAAISARAAAPYRGIES